MRVGPDGDSLSFQEMSVEIDHGADGVARPDVNHQNDEVCVEGEHCRPTASRGANHRTLDNPALCEQLLHNQRHR